MSTDKRFHFWSAMFGAVVGVVACGGGNGIQKAIATATSELFEARSGLIASGNVSGPTIASAAAAFEAQGTGDAGVSVFRTGPCTTNDEDFIAFWARDAAGAIRKNMSISTSWKNCSATGAYTWMRLNSTWVDANGVSHDDIQISLIGGKGLTFGGSGGDPADGFKLQNNYRTLHTEEQVFQKAIYIKDQIIEPATVNGEAALFVDAFGALKIKFGNGTVKTVTLQ